MSLMTLNLRTESEVSAGRGRAGGWSALLLPLLAAAGMATVIVGSYATWATFYAGLIARDGVAGHGKYFIGLAAAGALAVALAQVRGVWPGLRFAATLAGLAIAAVAFRDLRNLEALVTDPSAAFYVPGRGNGLSIVIAGAVVLAVAPFARGIVASGPGSLLRTVIAVMVVVGLGMLIPGLYGEYYLHLSQGHAHGHTEALNPAHLLTLGGGVTLAAAGQAALVRGLGARG